MILHDDPLNNVCSTSDLYIAPEIIFEVLGAIFCTILGEILEIFKVYLLLYYLYNQSALGYHFYNSEENSLHMNLWKRT